MRIHKFKVNEESEMDVLRMVGEVITLKYRLDIDLSVMTWVRGVESYKLDDAIDYLVAYNLVSHEQAAEVRAKIGRLRCLDA
jgi:hypothetical protein